LTLTVHSFQTNAGIVSLPLSVAGKTFTLTHACDINCQTAMQEEASSHSTSSLAVQTQIGGVSTGTPVHPGSGLDGTKKLYLQTPCERVFHLKVLSPYHPIQR
jgi:hypothetical protein